MSRRDHFTITPASLRQKSAWQQGLVAEPENVTDGVWAIPVPIPDSPLPATLAYLLEASDGSLHLIDPGWAGDESLHYVSRTLKSLGFRLDALHTVVATHFHPDHLGLCAALREKTGAHIVVSAVECEVIESELHRPEDHAARLDHRLDRWGVPGDRLEEIRRSFRRSSDIEPFVPDKMVRSGDRLEWPGHALEVIVTPGHTSGHICLVDRKRELLYTGDHILPGIFSGVGLGSLEGSSPLEDYLTSVDLLAVFDSFQVLPGHEYRFFGLRERREAVLAHHLRRLREVEQLWSNLGIAPVWEYAKHLTWTAGWEGMRDFWLYSALMQTDMHRELVASGRAATWLARESSSG